MTEFLDISVSNCECCLDQSTELCDQLEGSFPHPTPEQKDVFTGVLASGMYALGVLHERGHKVSLQTLNLNLTPPEL